MSRETKTCFIRNNFSKMIETNKSVFTFWLGNCMMNVLYPALLKSFVFSISSRDMKTQPWALPPILQFFSKKKPHQNQCSLMGCTPHLKMKPPPSEKQPSHPLKCEAPFHEIIPRKSTINNNLKSS